MRVQFALAMSAIVFISSCTGGGGDYAGKTGQVDGVVNLGDGPLTENCTMTFISKEGHAASAVLTGDGKYRMKFNGSNDIPVGTYRVGISPNIPTETKQDPSAFFNPDGTTKVVQIVTTKVPEKYKQPGSSGLEVVVKEGKQTLKIDLDLK